MWFSLFLCFAPVLFDITSQIQILPNPEVTGPGPNQTSYSTKERRALSELRALGEVINLVPEVDEYFLQDHVLIRFLRARGMDVIASGQMVMKALQWRRENRIETILNENILDLPIPPYTFEGHDNEGRPVVYFTPTSYDMRKFLLAGKRDAITRCFDQMLERGLHELKNVSLSGRKGPNGEEITQFVAILDMNGFSVAKHFCLQCPTVFIDWVKHYENFYPDALKYFVFINAFKSAMPLLEIFRPSLSTATQRAFKIFGPNKKEWSEFLLSVIPAEQLPVRYGGKKVLEH